MTIILGVFGESFEQLMDEHAAIKFCSTGWISTNNSHPNNPFNLRVVHEVCYNLDASTSCVFDVTHLELPFNETVITLKELHVVIHNQKYFDKTTFFVNSKQINKHKLKELFLLNEPIEFQDYDELFNL
ncbi:MAG TPA: hypothetical protein PLG47_05330 [Candidatus Dojkabacteria bacterium]|nr:hypothetical protein [Candidatus Dojkabacteria bacterium]